MRGYKNSPEYRSLTKKRAEEIFKTFVRTKQEVGSTDAIGTTCRRLDITRDMLNAAVLRVMS